MSEETNKGEHTTAEKIESLGQIIVGELEQLGGILTGDPISQAEGRLTEDAGAAHYEAADQLEESSDNSEDSE